MMLQVKHSLSNHGFSQGDEITRFEGSIGKAYAIDTVTSDTFTFVGGHVDFTDAEQINFLETTNLFQQDGLHLRLLIGQMWFHMSKCLLFKQIIFINKMEHQL